MWACRIRLCICSLAIATVIASAPLTLGAQEMTHDDADSREIASYRLTMEAVDKMGVAMRAAAEEARKDPRREELGRIESELETLRKKEEPSEAEQARIEQLSSKQTELENQVERPGLFNDANTLDDMEQAVRKEPLLSAALAKAGMPPREFAKFTFAMLGGSFAAGMQKAGMLKQLPKGVNAENVKFILEHEAELQKLQAEMKGSEK